MIPHFVAPTVFCCYLCFFIFLSLFFFVFWKVGKLESSLGRRRPSSLHGQSKNGAKLVSSTPKEKCMSVR